MRSAPGPIEFNLRIVGYLVQILDQTHEPMHLRTRFSEDEANFHNPLRKSNNRQSSITNGILR